jgi:hypothetical protein
MKKLQIAGAILSIAGLIATVTLLFTASKTALFLSQSQQTSGKVVDMIVRSTIQAPDSAVVKTTIPVIRFKDAQGADHEFECSPSEAVKVRIGQKVDIRYIKGKETSQSRIARSFLDNWGFIMILGVISILLDGIGFPLFFASLKKESEKK